MKKTFNLNFEGWSYVLEQDPGSGHLSVVEVKPANLIKKAIQYAKAEASGLVGSVSLPVIDQRKAACDTCESRKLVGPDEWYCKSCGCPEWERSRLQVKWELPAATCPLAKWPG